MHVYKRIEAWFDHPAHSIPVILFLCLALGAITWAAFPDWVWTAPACFITGMIIVWVEHRRTHP